MWGAVPRLIVRRATSRRQFCLPYTLVGQRVLYCELLGGRSRYKEVAVGWLAPTKPISWSHIALFGEQRGYPDSNGGGEVLHQER